MTRQPRRHAITIDDLLHAVAVVAAIVLTLLVGVPLVRWLVS